MSGTLTLTLTVPARSGSDQALLGVVALANTGTGPVTVNARLNLPDGDLVIDVDGPTGTLRAGWPWPADSLPREVELGPGEVLEAGVLLLCTAASQPLFPGAGAYILTASYPAGPITLEAEPVRMVRTPATGAAAAALRDRDVIQSLASASVLGQAAAALAALAADGGMTATLAALATGAGTAAADLTTAAGGPIAVATAASAVLPATDPRHAEIALAVAGDARAASILAGSPHRAP
ncbi:hypothetical protein [Occultella gossypii]|uniref:Uncharacterized protein n=1 Tax=Occultella gossypii TaxID=2800820 RepID=A0ABS7S3M8_9MICO|nr:hypothetical protein [Occultella gossypii]MBZ2194902.1 hypothetical protein [Occultella gossypii]